MIDFSVVETEIGDIAAGLTYSFKSKNVGYIREVVTLSEMPASDVAATGHNQSYDTKRHYEIPCVARFATWDWSRTNSSTSFKEAVEQFCAAIEVYRSSAVDAVRNIQSAFPSAETGDGNVVRLAVVKFTCLSHQ